MKTNKVSLVISAISILFVVFSIFWLFKSIDQYYFDYPDTSQLAIGVGIGIILLSVGLNGLWNAYIFHWMTKTEENNKKLDKRMDSVVSWWTKEELKNV